MQRITEASGWFFKNINKIDTLLARLTNWKREKTQNTKIKNEIGDIITDLTEIKKILREYYEQLYVNKLDNLDETVKFLEMYKLPILTQEGIENLNGLRTNEEIESVI